MFTYRVKKRNVPISLFPLKLKGKVFHVSKPGKRPLTEHGGEQAHTGDQP